MQDRKEHKRYVIMFMVTLLSCLVVLTAAALYIQPLEGELTRLGSYAERDFGWNLPQKKIRGDARLVQDYKGEADVLIVGDSFATNGVWQPFFRQMTGLSYVTLNIRKTSFPNLLDSEGFRNNPPKFMIVQSVERELIYFFRNLPFSCNNSQAVALPLLELNLTGIEPSEYYEETRKTFDMDNINLKYAASVIVKTVVRTFTDTDSRETKQFSLSKKNLFSNRLGNELLIYKGDMDKFAWSREDLSLTACAIRGLQEAVQSNGKTRFIFMLAPDKSTAYAEYIANPTFRNLRDTQQQLLDYGINAPRIDLRLKEAIDQGEKDIYTPSGTHWSARGYLIAAEVLVESLKKQAMGTDKPERFYRRW